MKVAARSLAVLITAATVVSGCGGSDSAAPVSTGASSSPDDSSPATTASSSPQDSSPATTAAVGCEVSGTAATLPDELTAVIPADIPDEFVPAIGPVEIYGDALPALENGVPIADDPARCALAPVVLGEGFDGNEVRIDAASDGPTMVVFLAHWCPHCNAEIPRLLELRDAGRYPEGLNIVAVSTAPNPERPNFPPAQWLTDMDWTYPVMKEGVDEQLTSFMVADAFGVSAFPFVVLLDSDGHVAARYSGEHEPDEIIDLITENLGLS